MAEPPRSEGPREQTPAAEPTRSFPFVLQPPGGPSTVAGVPAYDPERTAPFREVLAAGDQATRLPDGPPPGAPERTVGFAPVLPVPGARGTPKVVEAGTVLGGFVLGRRLAARPTCDVFAAHQPQHGECVVQVLTEGMAASPAGRAFLLEARVRTTIEDPRLPRLLGLGDSPRPWVALERLGGETLRQALDRGPLGAERAGRLVLELARGLARVHARHLCHGDITPGDVRLIGDRVVLGGFGVWKSVDVAGARCAFPGGPALGAATHMAPEQVVGERPAPTADVWALGLLLVEATTGRPLFGGEPREVMAALLERALPDLPPDLPPPLAAVARRCLERHPTRRFASAQEVAQALHAALPEQRVDARRPWLAITIVAVIVALAVGLLALAVRAA